ncbi:uncharacterized protein [Branchiostoma lanceolatum]|uniref:uncharacterized protein isoform X6 n=1 Tax=Branchiostoma lanceolatum TaxID=7740 RepID=UPI003456604D
MATGNMEGPAHVTPDRANVRTHVSFRAFQDFDAPDDFTRHSNYPSLTTLAKDFRVVSCVSALLACLLIIISLTSANDNALVEVVVFGIGLGCFLPGISFLVYLAWCESCAPTTTMTEHVQFPYRSREGVREDLPSVRDGGQIQVVVPSPPPYEEVTSQDRRHLGNQSEASDAPRPPPYASVAEVDERTRQQTSRTEEPRSSEQCPSYTEAIRSPTSGSPTDEMPSELPPVPPPAYEEVVNR